MGTKCQIFAAIYIKQPRSLWDVTTPIFELVKQIENDDIGLRTMRLITKLGVETVEGLAQYSAAYLRTQTANPDAVVDVLGTLLEQKYHITFQETYRL